MASVMKEREELRTVTLERRNAEGDVVATVELDKEIFGRPANIPLLHQVVTAQLAARRSGTHSTRTRAEVAGGAAKPYRQKGTGRARQGTIRAPQFAGGGVAFGPKPRSYRERTPRKMTRLALSCALSDRAAEGKICLVDRWTFEIPRTKDAISALRALGLEGNVLVVLGSDDAVAERSFANLPEVDLVEAEQLTAYDVMVSDWVVFTDASVPGEVKEVAGAPKPAAKARKATPTKAAAKKAPARAEKAPAEKEEAEPKETPAQPDEADEAPAAEAAGDDETTDEGEGK